MSSRSVVKDESFVRRSFRVARLFWTGEGFNLSLRQRFDLFHRRRHCRGSPRDEIDFHAPVTIPGAGLGSPALLLSRMRGGSAYPCPRFRSLVGANPIDPDARWIDLGTRGGTATQHCGGVQRTLFIEGNGGLATATRHPRRIRFFTGSAVADKYDVVITARYFRSCIINQDALTAVVHTRVVLREDHVIESLPNRLAAHGKR